MVMLAISGASKRASGETSALLAVADGIEPNPIETRVVCFEGGHQGVDQAVLIQRRPVVSRDD